MRIDKFVNKLNKLDNNIYTIEEEITVVNGQYKALLEHDNVKIKSINVYTGSMLTGTRINDVILSTPSSTPWKTEIQVFTDSTKIYITYETVGDTVEAEDINMLQDSIVYIQEESNKYQKSNDNKVSELTKNKVDKVQGKQLSTNDYTNAEKDKLSNIEENANRYIHPNDSNIRHVTDVEKNTWNSKETVEDSQAKANTAKADAIASAKAYTDEKLAGLVNSAPETLDTLQELADALGNDPNFATTVSNKIGTKADTSYVNAELAKKANASHGTHVTYGTAAPLANGTASAGTSSSVSRADHVHPVQTSVSGNAGTATKLATARTINGTNFDGSGNITTANWGTARTITIGNTGKSVNGSANVSWSLSEIGAAAASHGRHISNVCETVTDWNNATKNGWYMGNNAANGPTTVASGGTIWYFGEVIAHSTNYVVQTVYQFTASTDAKAIPKYIRAKMNGTWGAWTNVTVAKAVPSNAVFTDTNTWRGIQDNLTSTSTTDSLSANQGKVLKGLIDSKANASHTHTKSQISDFPTKLSQFEDDLGVGQLPSRFTWNMLKGV